MSGSPVSSEPFTKLYNCTCRKTERDPSWQFSRKVEVACKRETHIDGSHAIAYRGGDVNVAATFIERDSLSIVQEE